MTTLNTDLAFDWADCDTRTLVATIEHTQREEVMDWIARRALTLASKHPNRAADIVRAIDAGILVRQAELAALDAAKAAGYEEYFAARAAAQANTEYSVLALVATEQFVAPLNVLSVAERTAVASATHPLNETADGRPLNVIAQQATRHKESEEASRLVGVSLGDQGDGKSQAVEGLSNVTDRRVAGSSVRRTVGEVGALLGEGGRVDALVGHRVTHKNSPSLDGSSSPSVGAGPVGEVPPASPTGSNTTGQVAQ